VKPNVMEILFIVMSAWVLLAALYVVLTKNIVRAAFTLLAALFGVAVMYVLLQADFLAAVQVVIYVGGINILIIFGVMLTEHLGGLPLKMVSLNLIWAALTCAGLFAVLVLSLLRFSWPPMLEAHGNTTAGIGTLLLGNYLLPFEVTSVLLLAVLVGAVAVARKEVRGK
jgi:NADH:ubiquinone oxidoreductase subunit 6 (subunit J)